MSTANMKAGTWLAEVRRLRLASLPDELMLGIAAHLNISDLNALVQTCSKLRDLLNDSLYRLDLAKPVNRWDPQLNGRAIGHGCIHGYANTISMAIRNGAKIRHCQSHVKYSATPLTMAVNGDAPWKSVPTLLSHGVNPNDLVISKLQYDVIPGKRDMTEFARSTPLVVLIEQMQPRKARGNQSQRNALLLRTIRYLLLHGADPNLTAAPASAIKMSWDIFPQTYPWSNEPMFYDRVGPEEHPWRMGSYTALAAATVVADWDKELCAELVKCLLDHGANPNGNEAPLLQPDKGDSTAFEYLLWVNAGHFTIQVTPLQACIFREEHEYLINMLVADGADPNYRRPIPDWVAPKLRYTQTQGRSPRRVPPIGTDLRFVHPSVDMMPLELCLRQCRGGGVGDFDRAPQNVLSIAKALLRAGADPNGMIDVLYGHDPGHEVREDIDDASVGGSCKVLLVPYLVEMVTLWPHNWICEFFLAEMVELLVHHGADPFLSFEVPGSIKADIERNAAMILMRSRSFHKTALELRVLESMLRSTNKGKPGQVTHAWLLHTAIIHQKVHLVKCIIENGGNPNALVPNQRKRTPLLRAAISTPNIIKILLKMGAYPDSRDHDGRTMRDACIEKILLILRIEALKFRSGAAGCPPWPAWRDSPLFAQQLVILQMLYIAGTDLKLDAHIRDMLPEGICRICLGDVGDGDVQLDHGDDDHTAPKRSRVLHHRPSDENFHIDPGLSASDEDDSDHEEEAATFDSGSDIHSNVGHETMDPPCCVCMVKLDSQLVNRPSREHQEIDQADDDRQPTPIRMAWANSREFWRKEYLATVKEAGSSWWESWTWERPGL